MVPSPADPARDPTEREPCGRAHAAQTPAGERVVHAASHPVEDPACGRIAVAGDTHPLDDGEHVAHARRDERVVRVGVDQLVQAASRQDGHVRVQPVVDDHARHVAHAAAHVPVETQGSGLVEPSFRGTADGPRVRHDQPVRIAGGERGHDPGRGMRVHAVDDPVGQPVRGRGEHPTVSVRPLVQLPVFVARMFGHVVDERGVPFAAPVDERPAAVVVPACRPVAASRGARRDQEPPFVRAHAHHRSPSTELLTLFTIWSVSRSGSPLIRPRSMMSRAIRSPSSGWFFQRPYPHR